MRELTEQEIVRREKAEKIKELGLDPFGHSFKRTAFANDIKDKYKNAVHPIATTGEQQKCIFSIMYYE